MFGNAFGVVKGERRVVTEVLWEHPTFGLRDLSVISVWAARVIDIVGIQEVLAAF